MVASRLLDNALGWTFSYFNEKEEKVHLPSFLGPIPLRDWEERNSPQAAKSFLMHSFGNTRNHLPFAVSGNNFYQHQEPLSFLR
jgi:hypothetical protein